MNELTLNIVGWVASLVSLGTFQWIYTRKSTKRLSEAQAALAESEAELAEKKGDTEAIRDDFHLTQELLTEIRDKTRLIRELNDARLKDATKIHTLEMQIYDTECQRRPCAFRMPNKPFTPCYPSEDISVFEYFGLKQKCEKPKFSINNESLD